jgi:ubiquitin-like protein Pup
MATGDQKRKPKPETEEEEVQAEATKAETDVAEETEELLDEIDSVLEVNAEDFVKAFVQKGGQ